MFLRVVLHHGSIIGAQAQVIHPLGRQVQEHLLENQTGKLGVEIPRQYAD